MSALHENVEVAIQTEQVSMPNSATQTEQVPQAEIGTQTVQAGQPEVAIPTEQVGHLVVATQTDHLTQSEVATQTEQAREPEAATQTVRATLSETATQTNQVRPEQFPNEACNRPKTPKSTQIPDETSIPLKTPQSKTEGIYWTEQLSPPNAANAPRADRIAARRRLCIDQMDEEPPARSQRFEFPPASQQSTPTQFLHSQSSDDIPIIPPAQLPPLPPGPIEFSNPKVLKGPVAKGDASVTINRPIINANLPTLQHPGQQFYQWLRAHRITGDPRQVQLVMRDLEIRRRFLMKGLLPQDEQQFVISHIPPAYQSTSDYLRALAGLALMCYDREQAFALLFCFSKLRRHALNNFLNRL